MKKGLALVNVKQSTGPRASRRVRFCADLDTALGLAEESLLHDSREDGTRVSKVSRELMGIRSGFEYALRQIDELHGQDFADSLLDLEPYVKPLELKAGDYLFQCDGGVVQESQRGLFFIESGLLKLERDASKTTTMTRTLSAHTLNSTPSLTLKHEHARMGSIARRASMAKAGLQSRAASSNLRLMRFGAGW